MPTAARLILLLLLAFTAPALATTNSQVYDYIANDQIDQARITLGALIRTEYANAERLYLSGLLTAAADSAVDYYHRALKLANSEDVIAGSLIGIANYCLMQGNQNYALELIDDYRGDCDHSSRYPELMRLRALLRFAEEDQWKSRGEVKDGWEDCKDQRLKGALALTLGDIYAAQSKCDEALEYYRPLTTATDSRYFGAASLRMIDCNQKDNNADQAQLTYNVVKSRHPLTLGLAEIGRGFGDSGGESIREVDEFDPSSGGASKYAIRVGTYSSLAEAEAQQRRFTVQGYTATLGRVRISGNNYYVVDVGEFSRKTDATRVMEQLAAANRDTYHLVTF